jgi:4-hydroxy 2-oxovalerate aldolase
MISGVLNEHPRSAMAHMESERKNNIVEFYDKMTGEQGHV